MAKRVYTFGQRAAAVWMGASLQEVSKDHPSMSHAAALAKFLDRRFNAALRKANGEWLRDTGLHKRHPKNARP